MKTWANVLNWLRKAHQQGLFGVWFFAFFRTNPNLWAVWVQINLLSQHFRIFVVKELIRSAKDMAERSKYRYGAVSKQERAGDGQQRVFENDRHGNDKKSIFVVGLMVLLGETCRGILFPTLWLRVQSVGGTPSGQGIAVATFSFGRLIGSLFLGLSADCFSYKSSLFGSTLFIMLGASAYVFAESLNALFVAQLILGLGSGR